MILFDYISTIKEILERIEFQITQSLQDLSTNQFDQRLTPETKSIHETLAHLIDVCYAYQYLKTGEKYQWESFNSQQIDQEHAFSLFLEIWKQTSALAYQITTEEEFIDAIEYLALHSSYHIGQICALRMKIDPEWNAKSIYKYKKG